MPSTLKQYYIVYTKTDSECIVSDSTGTRCFWTQYFGSIWSLVPVARCWRLRICWWYGGSVCCFSWPGYVQCIMHMYVFMYSCVHGRWVWKCTFMHSYASACGACLKTLPSSIEYLALKLPSALWSRKAASSGCIDLRPFFPIHFEPMNTFTQEVSACFFRFSCLQVLLGLGILVGSEPEPAKNITCHKVQLLVWTNCWAWSCSWSDAPRSSVATCYTIGFERYMVQSEWNSWKLM